MNWQQFVDSQRDARAARLARRRALAQVQGGNDIAPDTPLGTGDWRRWIADQQTTQVRECDYCGHRFDLSMLNIRYIVSRAIGGTQCIDNAAFVCEDCTPTHTERTWTNVHTFKGFAKRNRELAEIEQLLIDDKAAIAAERVMEVLSREDEVKG